MAWSQCQDLDRDFIPIIRETMSASDWALEQYTGTPKTLDGTLASLFSQSSQAEWVIRCDACNYWNIPALEHDLDAMTGPNIVTRDISEESPGVVCAQCGRPVFPRTGRWVHRRPELRHDFAGYHVPQLIMPMHYANPEKWAILLGKRQGFGNTTTAVYYNECCGESYDSGAKLVTLTEIKAAAVLQENTLDNAVKALNTNRYTSRILSIDWGGGGDEEISFTTAALLGLQPDGKIDVLFGWRSLTPHDHFGEVRRLLQIMSRARCTHAVHDYSGAGATRETIMVSAGMPAQNLVPISYVRAASGPLMRLIEANEATGQRTHFRVDKARSLVLTCNLIKRGWIRFFAYDYIGPGQEGLLHDFLALTESKVDTRLGTDIYTVIRSARGGPDDFAQAVNIGVCALYWQQKKWPDMAEVDRLTLTPEQLAAVTPRDIVW